MSISLGDRLEFAGVGSDLKIFTVVEFVGREEIDEVEEGSTEIGRQRSKNRCIEAGREESGRPPGQPVDRARSTGQSTDVHDVHRISSVDRPVDRGMEWSTVRSTD